MQRDGPGPSRLPFAGDDCANLKLTAPRSPRNRLSRALRILALGAIVAGMAFSGGLGLRSDSAAAQASSVGQWSAPITWPNIAIHTTVLPTGEVIHYSYPADGQGSEVWLWNPGTSDFEEVPVGSSDIFCSGHALLPDGKLVSFGGTDPDSPLPAEYWGHPEINRYDSATGQWSFQGNMERSRWYPTITALSDGKLLIMSGYNEAGDLNNRLELYDPATGGTDLLPSSASIFIPLYPWNHLLPNGQVFTAGPHNISDRFNPSTNTWTFVDASNFGHRDQGTSVLLPLKAPGYNPEVMIMGGNWPTATNTTERINLGAPTPLWQYADNMNYSRRHANSLLLPDGKVLVTGGTASDNDPANAVLPAEIYDPATNDWTTMAGMQRPRMYHSSTVLLPDGRVLTAGTDGELTGEVFSPPYLFNGSRPAITSMPASVGYAGSLLVTTPDAASISKVMLMKPSSVTHSLDMGQRAVELAFTTGSGNITVTAPPNGNVAPPGHYMLFILNSSGVPSVAKWVHVSGSPAPTPSPTASPTASPTPTPTPAPTPTPTPAPTPSPTPTQSPSPTPSPAPTPSPTPSPSPTPPPDSDLDGVPDSTDNCPALFNPGQQDADDDGTGDLCDAGDSDGDGYADSDEARHIGTAADTPCGAGWPSNVYDQSASANRLDIQDVVSFVSPVRRINTMPPDPGYDSRWDLDPGPNGVFTSHINIVDLGALVNGVTGNPPMFGGQRAFNEDCPYAP